MKICVAYASQHGATRGIAERLGATLRDRGLEVEVRQVDAVERDDYDAFVIGSASYLGHWSKEATGFVRAHQATLATRPVWLFSSGPLGTDATDAQGRDLRAATEPKEIPEFREAVHPRDHHVFFGALDPSTLGLRDRVIRAMPAGRGLLPEGDFRDWAEIEAWAEGIARDLAQLPTG